MLRQLAILICACGAPSTPTHAPPSIAVLDAGAEPRTLLRHTPTLHAPEHIEYSTKVRVTTEYTNTVLESGQVLTNFPTVQYRARLEATGTTADRTNIRFDLEDVTVLDDMTDPSLRARLVEQVMPMKGTRSTWQLAPSGATSAHELDAPNLSPAQRDELAQIRNVVQGLHIAFPDVPVGVGARWLVTSRVVASKIKWDRKATYTVRGITNAAVTLDVEQSMTAPSQALSVEPSSTSRLTSGTSNTTGSITIPLRGLVPTGESRSLMEADYAFVRGHKRILSTVRTEMLFFVKPASE